MKRAMTWKRHRPEEIVAKSEKLTRRCPQGKTLEDVAKSLGVSLITLHRWRTEYGSTDRDAVKRLKELERENERLKRLVANQALDIQILKELAKGNSKPVATVSGHPTRHRSLHYLATTSMSRCWSTSKCAANKKLLRTHIERVLQRACAHSHASIRDVVGDTCKTYWVVNVGT